MNLTPERKACLQLISLAGGRMNHDDERLAPFCDDNSTLTTPDVFNQCHDAGWLTSRHDDRTGSSEVYLTEAGSNVLEVAKADGTRTAPDSCPHCFNEDDCGHVEICRAVDRTRTAGAKS